MNSGMDPSEYRRDTGKAIGAAVLIASIGWIITLPIGWTIASLCASISNTAPFEIAWLSMPQHITDSVMYFLQVHLSHGIQHYADSTKRWYDWTLIHPTIAAIYIYSSVATNIFFAVGLFIGVNRNHNLIRHKSGFKVINDTEEGLKFLKRKLKTGFWMSIWEVATRNIPEEGIKVHPDDETHIDLLSETKHFLYVGKSGGGKTQSLLHNFFSAYERGDRILCHDAKGDYSQFFSIEDYKSHKVVMINPQDLRGTHHALCQDTMTRTDPELLAANLIKVRESDQDFWSKSGKDVLAGVIAALHAEKPGGWSWKDFAAMFDVAASGKMEGKPVLLLAAIKKYRPASYTHLSAAEQAAGVLSNIRVDTAFLDHLAHYWPRRTGGFSLRKWVKGTAHKKTQVVILRNISTEEYYSGALATQFSLALSEAIALPEGDARLWMYIDEWPQLNRINLLKKGLEMLRSRGVRVVLGSQSDASVKDIYGENDTQVIMEQIDSFFIGRCVGETATWVSSLFGKAVQERMQNTLSANQNMQTVIDPSQQASMSWQRQEVDALPPGDIATLPESKKPTAIQAKLGKRGGPTLYVSLPGLDSTIVKLFYPYTVFKAKCKANYPRLDKHIKGDPETKKSGDGKAISAVEAWLEAQEKRKEEKVKAVSIQEEPIQRPIKTAKKTEAETINQKVKPVKQDDKPAIDEGGDPMEEMLHETIDQASEAVAGVNLGTVFDAAETLLMEDRGTGKSQQVIEQSSGSCDSEDKAKKKKKVKDALKKMSAGGKK